MAHGNFLLMQQTTRMRELSLGGKLLGKGEYGDDSCANVITSRSESYSEKMALLSLGSPGIFC